MRNIGGTIVALNIVHGPTSRAQLIIYSITWTRPSHQFIKLSIDDRSFSNPGIVGFSGVFRNEDGDWLLGFLGYV